MSNKTPKKDIREPQNKLPKFNSYWIYGIILAIFIGFQLMKGASSISDELSENDFNVMLADNDIDKIVIVNKDIAYITIKADALSKEKHKNIGKPSFLKDASAPHYVYDFGDLQNFENALNAKKDELQLDFDKSNKKQTNIMSELIGWLPFILLIALWIFFTTMNFINHFFIVKINLCQLYFDQFS